MPEFPEQGVHTLLITVSTGWLSMEKAVKRALGKWVFLLLHLINHPLSTEVLNTLSERRATKNMRHIASTLSESSHVFLERHYVESRQRKYFAQAL